MDKILEALKKLLPAHDVSEVAAAVEEQLNEARAELEAEFNSKLETAYAELSKELTIAEQVAEKGYAEAYAIIGDLRNRIETLREEYEAAQTEGYEEAYKIIETEKAKYQKLEDSLYNQYDGKLLEMKAYIVEKVHQFLKHKGTEIYEQARRDLLSDPRIAESRVALDRIVDITSGYLDTDGRAAATGTRLEEAYKQIDDLKAQLKLTEGRYIRADMESKKLVKEHRMLESKINESRNGDKQERVKNGKSVTGRGRLVEDGQVEVIREYHETAAPKKTTNDDTAPLTEANLGVDFKTLGSLAGVKRTK
jgi:hypothetical protein